MNLRLIHKQGGRRKVIPLRQTVAVLGRAHGNAVRIPSADVSRRHCRLIAKDGVVTVEDMESVNGTFLNGRKLKGPQLVHPGDEIELGPVKFTVEYDLTADAKARLRGKEDDVELLQALADGEAVADGDVPELELIDDDLADVEPVKPADDLEPLPAVEFDFEEPWQMPNGGDLRDLLSQMEDEEPTRAQKPKKRRD
jgi:pSer/pThr/pTyr-binding forkhead associated (FHA) protein